MFGSSILARAVERLLMEVHVADGKVNVALLTL